MKRRTIVISGAAASLITCFTAASAQTSSPIRLGLTPSDQGLLGVCAQEQGFFLRTGLNVDVQPFTNAGTLAQALVAGSVDVAVLDALQIGNAVIHGIPLAMFAAGAVFSKDSPTLVLVVSKSSPIRVARDLENQVVAVPILKSLSLGGTKEWLRIHGADPEKVKFFELSFSEMSEALQRGSIGGAVLGEPYLSAGRSVHRVVGAPFEALGAPFYINGFAASRPWLAGNSALASRLATSLYETASWANSHRPETALIESRYTKLSAEVVRSMARNLFATSFNPRLTERVLDIGARYQLIDRPIRSQDIAITL